MKKWLLLLIPLFFLIPKDTFALTSRTIPPDLMYSFSSVGSSVTSESISTYSILNDTFYGHNFQVGSNYFAMGWYYSTYNYISFLYNDVYDLNFVIYSTFWNSQSNVSGFLQPLRVHISDQQNRVFTCETNSSIAPQISNSGNLGSYGSKVSRITTVSCKNVNVSSSFDVILSDTFTTQDGGTVAISNLTATKSDGTLSDSIDKNTQEQEETNQKLDDIKDSITDSDTSSSEDTAGGFFNDFSDDDYGLSDIVTLPLEYIKQMSSSCQPLTIPAIDFLNNSSITFPCMSSIYSKYFGSFLTIWQIITFGLVAYRVIVQIFAIVNDLKNPDSDNVEVMEL